MLTEITEVHFNGGDTVEVTWRDAGDVIESRHTTTIAHDEDIAFLNMEDMEADEHDAALEEWMIQRHNRLN